MGMSRRLTPDPASIATDGKRNGRRLIAAVRHRRESNDGGAPTACLVELRKGHLEYGREVPLHFSVAPRTVVLRDAAGARQLAISRLEAVAASPDDVAACKRRDLVFAAWPWSLGLVTHTPFRRRTKTSVDEQLQRVAAKKENMGNLLATLEALDGLANDPFLTRRDQRVAGRFVLGQYDRANHSLRVRTQRAAATSKRTGSAGGEPGWILGLCEFDRCLETLKQSRGEIERAAGAAYRIPPAVRRDAEALAGFAVAATERAMRLALAGYRSVEDRRRAEESGDLSVVTYCKFIAQSLCQTMARSDPSARDRAVAIGGDADAAEHAADDQALENWRQGD